MGLRLSKLRRQLRARAQERAQLPLPKGVHHVGVRCCILADFGILQTYRERRKVLNLIQEPCDGCKEAAMAAHVGRR